MEHTELHLLLLRSFNLVNRELLQQMAQAQLLPGQPKILEFLLTHDGCTQKEIGAGCILDKSTVTSLLKRMEASNLIYKQHHPQDQRSLLIHLSPLGREKALWVQGLFHQLDEKALAGISTEERESFFRTFNKILHNQHKADA